MSVISVGNAEQYVWGEGCFGWHLLKSDRVSVIQERVPAGKGEMRHFHRRAHQFFFLLEGEAELEMEGNVFPLRAHEGIEVRPGIPHCFRNTSSRDVVFLVVSVPPSHGDRVNT